MKKSVNLFLAACFPALAFAQAPLAQSSDSSRINRKNEVWLNVLPMVGDLAQMTPEQRIISLMYKRQAGDYWLRLGAHVSPAGNRIDLGATRLQNDTTYAQSTNLYKTLITGARAGVEVRRKWRSLQTFAGADLVYEYRRHRSEYYYTYYRVNSLPAFPDIHHNFAESVSTSGILYRVNRNVHFGGLGLVGGLIVPLSNRFAMSAQSYILFGYSQEQDIQQDLVNEVSTRRTTSHVGYDLNIIHEINLVYKF